MSKRSGAGILAGNSFRGSGKRGALLFKGGALGKGDEPGTPRGVPVKGKDGTWMSDKQLKRQGINEVSVGGEPTQKNSFDTMGSDGQTHV